MVNTAFCVEPKLQEVRDKKELPRNSNHGIINTSVAHGEATFSSIQALRNL